MDNNQINPPHRLSDDIFFIVFKLVESSATNTLQPLERKAPFNISLVSKHWRQLVLDLPSLWTKIDAVNVHMLPTLIERSKGSPLVIELLGQNWHLREYSLDRPSNYPSSLLHAFEVQANHFNQYVGKLLPYVYRWKRFKIEARFDVNLEGLCSPAPELQALCLVSSSSTSRIRLPVSLFQDHTPRLRSVSLYRVHIPLSSPIYTGLERLVLHSDMRHGELPQLVQNIASCPLLKYLRLKVWSGRFYGTQKPPKSVNLPHLRRLFLNLNEPNIIYILSSFLFPALVELSMILDLDRDDPRLTPMDTNIVERLPILTRIRSVRVTIDPRGHYFVVTGRDSLWHETDIEIFNLLYGTCKSIRLVELVLSAFGKEFPLPALEQLYFHGFSYAIENPDPLPFVRTLLNFPTVTCLILCESPPSFLEALFVDSESRSHPCPLLERLVIFDSHSDLIRIVKSRLENPRRVAPLRRLTIGSHTVNARTLSALRELPLLVEVNDDYLHDYWKPNQVMTSWPLLL